MTPSAQSNLEHGQDVIVSKSEHVETPGNHESIQHEGVYHLPQPFQLTS